MRLERVILCPRDLSRPFEARVGDIRVRSLFFSLEGTWMKRDVGSCARYCGMQWSTALCRGAELLVWQ
jgi:hypothetical protein